MFAIIQYNTTYYEHTATGVGLVQGEIEPHNWGVCIGIQAPLAVWITHHFVQNQQGFVVASVYNWADKNSQANGGGPTFHRDVRVL